MMTQRHSPMLRLGFDAMLVALLATIGGACRPAPPDEAEPPPYASATPLTTPRLFAPGVISTGQECNVSLSPDGHTAYFNRPDSSRTHAHIFVSRFAGGAWQQAERVAFSDDRYSDLDPFVAPDGARLYFASTRPVEGTEARDNHDIWFAPRQGDRWGTPQHTGAAVNSDAKEGYPSLTTDGTLFFFSDRPGGKGENDLYRARPSSGGFAPAENLTAINTPLRDVSPAVSPDGRYVVFYHVDADRNADLFVSRRQGDAWSPPQKLDPIVSSAADEVCPTLSPDGRYLFFARFGQDVQNGVYQIDAEAAGL